MTEFELFHKWVMETLEKVETYPSGPVFSDGTTIAGASWDRKMSFLLFMFTKGMSPP